jgi:cation-transporting P-type ATPase E
MWLIKYKDVLLNHIFNRLNVVVFFFSFLLLLIGRYSEGFVSASIVVFNIIIAIYQEIMAKQKLAKLSFNNENLYSVTRNNGVTSMNLEIKQDDILVNDIINLKIGQQIPVDGEVLTGYIQVDEAFMTGESDLIDKKQKDQAFAGSNIFSGQCTFIALVNYENSRVKSLEKKGKVYGMKYTPIENKINRLIGLILVFIFWFIIVATVYLYINKSGFTKIILVNSVISGLVPSTLLAMVTIVNSWSIAKTFLNKENLLPQKLNAYESLANVDIFCFDKTGTLTTNKIRFVDGIYNQKIVSAEEFAVYSAIYSHNITSHTKSSETIKQNYNTDIQVNIIEEIPFNSQTKSSKIIVKFNDDIIELTLGAPELLIKQNSEYYKNILLEQNKGNRVLVMMIKSKKLSESILGYYVLKEELRSEIKDVFDKLERDGRAYKIISGDNPVSILSVANNIGLGIKKDEIISGYEIQKMPLKVLEKKIKSIKIFGRMTPEDKELIITLLKKHNYVAMIGDGVNDLLPVKKANLGIVLQSGATATKLASDLILLNDDYSSLIKSINYGKINKFILNSIYNIFFTRFLYLSVIYLTLVLVSKNLPFSVIHTSLISLLSVGLGVIALFNIVYKYQLSWKTINNWEFIIPSSILTVFLSLGLVYNMYSVGIKINEVSTSLVVFLVFCALGINLLSIIPSKNSINKVHILHVFYLFCTQLGIFCLLLLMINIKEIGKLWLLTTLSFSEYVRLGYFSIFWIFGFVIIYIFEEYIRIFLNQIRSWILKNK